MMICKKLQDPESEYRGTPFWSWNGELEPEELCRQIREMKKVGLGGAFMHARAGLTTEYMGKEWFDCIKACMAEGEKCNMNMWSYDENGWPSGYAGGAVTDLGEEYHLRYISLSETPEENTLACYAVKDGKSRYLGKTAEQACSDEKVYYIIGHINRYYVDILNPKVVRAFIDSTYEKYKEKLGEELGVKMPGFFTDEPQYARYGTPFSLYIPEAFEKAYGYDVFSNLAALFLNVEGCEAYRYDYWKLVSELYTTSYSKQIYEWCDKNGVKFTGHAMAEDTLLSQMSFTAGVMPMYEYMHIPGMDWLRRKISSPIIPKQVSSVASQLGKKFVLSETFAMCGWDVSWQELKWIAEWQYVNGVNFMCQHLEGYTVKGNRKRDYPPSMFIQSPWWEDYKLFNDYFARLGKILADGEQTAQVLVIHPMHSGWITFSSKLDNAPILNVHSKFESCLTELAEMHIDCHLGDETVISRHGSVDGKTFKVGKCSYSTVVIPGCITLDETTYNLLEKFVSNGGKVLLYGEEKPYMINGRVDGRAEELADKFTVMKSGKEAVGEMFDSLGLSEIKIVGDDGECGDIRCCKRIFEGDCVYFLANQSKDKSYSVKIKFPYSRTASLYDAVENKILSARHDGDYIRLNFEPMQSYIIVTGDKEKAAENADVTNKTYLALGCDWMAKPLAPNALTLDYARCKTDGEWGEPTPVLALMKELLQKRTSGNICLKYEFVIDPTVEVSKLKNIKLAHEYSDFEIYCNGQKIDKASDGYYIDRNIRTVDITKYLVNGINGIEFKGEFYQNPDVYSVLFGENVHETMLNKLTYDTEIESVYIIGDFSVRTLPFSYGERRAMFTEGGFSVTLPEYAIKGGNITENGFVFFSGKMMLSQNVIIKRSDTRYFVKLNGVACALCKLFVNGKYVKTMPWAPFEADVTEFIRDGENEIAVEITVSNRNLLGPHHHTDGELYAVAPNSFSQNYTDRYCFVSEGILG